MGIINRKVDPDRRLQRQHPYDVWRALFAMRLRDRMLGQEEAFYSPEQIAAVLYVNFDDLRPTDRTRVIYFKLHLPLAYLRRSLYAEIDQESRYSRMRSMDLGYPLGIPNSETFRARDSVFKIKGFPLSTMLDFTRSSMDKEWGYYIGRRESKLVGFD